MCSSLRHHYALDSNFETTLSILAIDSEHLGGSSATQSRAILAESLIFAPEIRLSRIKIFGPLAMDQPLHPNGTSGPSGGEPSAAGRPVRALKSELLALRQAHIGPNVALNYSRDPIVVLRGDKQHLYDEVISRKSLYAERREREGTGEVSSALPAMYGGAYRGVTAKITASCGGIDSSAPRTLRLDWRTTRPRSQRGTVRGASNSISVRTRIDVALSIKRLAVRQRVPGLCQQRVPRGSLPPPCSGGCVKATGHT